MNFFERQDQARKQTTRLVVLFVLAVGAIVATVNVALHWVMTSSGAIQVDRLQAHLIATGVTMMIIVAGSVYKSLMLAAGGQSVARMLGGRPLDVSNRQEAVLQNVVEEMSIASGVPVPGIYVMDREQGINAFAAGIKPDDMVIGVTQGTLQTLSRDELQGVIGHEFSHILNCDSRLNLRLISVLNGIMVISLIGMILLRSLQFVRISARRSNRNNGGAILAVLGVGIFMYVLGSVGVLFGRLIQAAVSRQREFLADASAVQFTRNPKGLAGALKKIGAAGSMVNSPHALESAHLFFGNATRFSLAGLLATHPPLADRIKAIDSTWDGRFDLGMGTTQVLDETPPIQRGDVLAGMLAGATVRRPINPNHVVEHAGEITPRELQFASELLVSFPPVLVESAHNPFGARAVIFAMLLSQDGEVRQKQFEVIEKNVELACYQQTLRLAEPIALLPAGARLPLLEMTLPALDSLSQLQATAVRIVIRQMIEADRKVTLFEYTLSRLVENRLPSMQLGEREPIEFYNVSAIRREAGVLLSALAEASPADTERAFLAGARSLDPDAPPVMVPRQGLGAIDAALKKLARSSPPVKKRLIEAAAHTVAADGQVTVTEAELLRATAATLDVPLPPFVAG